MGKSRKRPRDGVYAVYDSTENRPPKQPRHASSNDEHSPVDTELPVPLDVDPIQETSPDPKPAPKKKRFNMSTKLAAFPHELLREIQEEILSLEAEPRIEGRCRGCLASQQIGASRQALYRCLECAVHAPLCNVCIVEEHRRTPFHHIQRWMGAFFGKASLHDLGYVLHLGHDGVKCPCNTGYSNSFVIVHVNGIHCMQVEYCKCKPLSGGRDKVLQLIRHQLFPPTTEAPQTAFTFEVLDHFQRHSLSAKTSAYDYYDALRRHTDATFPKNVPNRYHEFRLVMRLWRHLTLRRRSGQEHGIDRVLTHRRPGSLAVRCFACPEVGFNVPEWVFELTLHDKIHVYTLFVSADGNFRLQRKRKSDDPDDKALNLGNAYFVNDDKFQEYLNGMAAQDVTSLCSNLKAVRQQNHAKFKDAVITGVVAIQCARHGFYLPQGMVDLTKGESFVKTDYALFNALNIEGLRQGSIVVSYDIWCQYHKKLQKRVEEKFPLYGPILKREELRGAVPKMHINAHKAECQFEHSFIYEPHSGMTCGEGIESAWSEQNHAAAFTKEQNPGHRHDTLDDFNGYWNWCKLLQLSSFLRSQRKKWTLLLEKRKASFSCFSTMIKPELLLEWDSRRFPEYSKAELYKANSKLPTRQEAYSSMLSKEKQLNIIGLTDFIQRGLEIEILQHTILQGINSDMEDERSKLLDMLRAWRIAQNELFPLLRPLPPINEEYPENTILLLPSSFTSNEHVIYMLTDSVQVETELRLGHVYDLLSDLRDSIHEYNYLVTDKKANPNSQSIATRSQRELQDVNAHQKTLMAEYIRSYDALEKMGGLTKDSELQVLREDHLWGKNVFLPHTVGDSSRESPWFWFIGRPKGMSDDNWLIELERVRWTRERAAIERLQEEVEILEEEFSRVHISFTQMVNTWNMLAEQNRASPGFVCYARRQAQMHTMFATQCWSDWKSTA